MVYWNVQRYQDKILEKVGLKPKSSDYVLDVGCGGGKFSEIFSREARCVIGIDVKLSPNWNKIKSNNNLIFILASACNLPFHDNVFDILFIKDVLHHLPRHQIALNKMKRVIKEQGNMVIIEANRYNPLLYIHKTVLEDHQHFTKRYFENLIKSNFKNFNFTFISTEAHVYPIKNTFLLKIINLIETGLERMPLVKNYISYNIAIIKGNKNKDNISTKLLSTHNKFEWYKHQKEYFDDEYKNYDEYRLENWRISYLQRIFTALDIGKNSSSDTYLDIGVGGSGYTVIEAAKLGCKSIGIDLSPEGVKKARFFANHILDDSKLCHFIVCSAEYLPFKNKCFSKVSSIAVLEHLIDDDRAIAEISRVTKDRGKLFITVPQCLKRILPLFWLIYYFHDKRVGHLRHYSEKELKEKFLKYNFIIRDVSYSAHLIKVVQFILSKIFPSMNNPNSRLWWKLEEIDLKQRKIKTGFIINLKLEKGMSAELNPSSTINKL